MSAKTHRSFSSLLRRYRMAFAPMRWPYSHNDQFWQLKTTPMKLAANLSKGHVK